MGSIIDPFPRGWEGTSTSQTKRFARRMLLANLCKFAKGLVGNIDIPNQAFSVTEDVDAKIV